MLQRRLSAPSLIAHRAPARRRSTTPEMKLGLAAKEKPAGLRRRAFTQFSRGVSYEVRDW
jgi:hypothetical protein